MTILGTSMCSTCLHTIDRDDVPRDAYDEPVGLGDDIVKVVYFKHSEHKRTSYVLEIVKGLAYNHFHLVILSKFPMV